jgi:hypothetical protein
VVGGKLSPVLQAQLALCRRIGDLDLKCHVAALFGGNGHFGFRPASGRNVKKP